MALETELETYKAHQMELVTAHEGQYVLIKGRDVAGIFDDYETALEAGYEKFGPVSFLVKKIQSVEPVQYFSRDLPPWPSSADESPTGGR